MKKLKTQPQTLKKLPTSRIRVMNPNAGGIDLGSSSHFVSVAADRSEESIREFRCFTSDLKEMVQFLQTSGVTTVAMEATGVYWLPVYEILEEVGMEVYLVNARHLKNVPVKKDDAKDADWLRELHMFGLLNASFVPDAQIRDIRNYWRLRERHIQAASREINHMQKALDLMNLHLHKVISDLTGKTGLAIIEAILNGERDPRQLAKYRNPRIRCSAEELLLSLEGNYQEAHLFELRQAYDLYGVYQQKIAECDQQLENQISQIEKKSDQTPPKKSRVTSINAPKFNVQSYLYSIYGVDFTQIDGVSSQTALTLLAEVGTDFSKFRNEKHFASWAGLSPHKKISGGKVLSSKTPKVQNKLAIALRRAAWTLKNNHSALGLFYRRMKARLGSPKAITATARKIACLIYRMATKGEEYIDIGSKQYEDKIKELQIKNLKRKAKMLGFQLTEIQTQLT